MHIKDIINIDKIREAARDFISPSTTLPKLSRSNLKPSEDQFSSTNPSYSPGRKKGFIFDL